MKYRLFKPMIGFFVVVFFLAVNPQLFWADSMETLERLALEITIDNLKKSAERGDAQAQCDLGMMYESGKVVSQDYKRAVYWYSKAAEQGNARGQYHLGYSYDVGQGVPQDYKIAAYWYAKAAEQGDAYSQTNLGMFYDYGHGVPQDYKIAAYWYAKAAEQGHALAQYYLASKYIKGEGVPQNFKYAYVWSNLAASKEQKGAKNMRDLLARELTPQQLVEAQELATKLHYEIKLSKESSRSEPATPKSRTTGRPRAKGSGSGFIISKDGFILTCHHVISDSSMIKVKVGDRLHHAKLVNKDLNNDLALLKISGTFPALAFSAKRIEMGQEVFTIGYPNPILQGVGEKLTKGSINSLTGIQDDVRLYQISVPVQPGNSGGPLLDMDGNITGIIVMILDAKTAFQISGSLPQNVNYAIKRTYAQAFLDTLPEVSRSLLPAFKKESFGNVVDRVKKSVVMIVVYN